MGFNEFQEMWTSLNQWKDFFMRFDEDRNGGIDINELLTALGAFGKLFNQRVPQAQTVLEGRKLFKCRICF